MKRKFYGYDPFNQSLYSKKREGIWGGVVAFLNIPLSRFKRTSGCVWGSAYELRRSHIGQVFTVSILDPVHIGKCKYLGRGLNAIPESEFKNVIKKYEEYINDRDKFVVFEGKLGNQIIFIVVEETWCDANPVKAKK